MNIHDGNYILEHVKRLNHMDMTGSNIKSTITCILPLADSVYTGDDEGRVVSKSLSNNFYLTYSVSVELRATTITGVKWDYT